MKRFVMAIALSCALSGSVLAGNIPTDGVVLPPPPPPATTPAGNDGDIPSVPGEIHSGDFADQITNELVLMIFGMFAR